MQKVNRVRRPRQQQLPGISITIQARDEASPVLARVRLQQHAHGAFGYLLPMEQIDDIWKLSRGIPVTMKPWPLPHVMRAIARSWNEINRGEPHANRH